MIGTAGVPSEIGAASAGAIELLALEDVCRRVRDGARELAVLDRVSLDVHEEELIGIYGDRRSGKSTLMRVIAGLESPDSGSVRFDGVDVSRLSISARARLRRRGGLAMASGESWPLQGGERVIEHVALPLTNEGLTLGESEGLARPALECVGATDLAHMRLARLSLSDRIRVELARALAREPRLLLFDEPAVLPGPSDSRALYGLLRSLAKSGIAVVIASEDMSALTGVQRFLTLSDGRLRSTDSRRRVIPFPASRSAAP